MTNYSSKLGRTIGLALITVFLTTFLVGILMTGAMFSFTTYLNVSLFATLVAIFPILSATLVIIFVLNDIKNRLVRVTATIGTGLVFGFPGIYMFHVVLITVMLLTYYNETYNIPQETK